MTKIQRITFIFALLISLLCTLSVHCAKCAQNTLNNDPVRVGILLHSPPLSFATLHSDGKIERNGLALELAQALNAKMGRSTIFYTGSHSQLDRMLALGAVDYIIVPKDGEEDTGTHFSLTTGLAMHRRLIVRSEKYNITSIESLKNNSLAILKKDIITNPISPYTKIITVDTYQTALQLLANGQVDAFLAPSCEEAIQLAVRDIRADITTAGPILDRNPIIICFLEPHTPLQIHVANALASLENEHFMEKLRRRWLESFLYQEVSFWEQHKREISITILTLFSLAFICVFVVIFMRNRIRQITEKLRISEQLYKDLFNNSPYIALVIDIEGFVYLYNTSARILKGLHDGNIKESIYSYFKLSENINILKKLLLDAAHNGHSECEMPLPMYNDINTRLFEIKAFAMPHYDENSIKICCLAIDVTNRIEMVKSERLAVIGKLAAGVAHEINNPLGIIRANAEMLKDMVEDEAIQLPLNAIQRNVDRASNITKRLMSLAVPKSTAYEKINLSDIFTECMDFLRMPLKHVQVNATKLPNNLPVYVDKLRIEQVIINLILNAVESMNNQGTLTVCGDMAQDTVRLIIHDTGRGIAKGKIGWIFDMFHTTATDGNGFGLGLFVCRYIVENHNGFLYAESEEGHGATFILELPSADSQLNLQ